MKILNSHSSEIARLCEIYSVRSLYAFGSVLTDNFKNESDIDLIVDFKNIPIEDYADNYFEFKFSLQDILQKPIDLLEEQAIKNPYFRKAVNEERRLIYG